MQKTIVDTIGVSYGHDASTCLLSDGDLILHLQEERLSRKVRDRIPLCSLTKVTKNATNINNLCISGVLPATIINDYQDYKNCTLYDLIIIKNYLKSVEYETFLLNDYHHLCHASQAFYNSGFEEAVCIVLDGTGSKFNVIENQISYSCIESHSVYTFQYPDKIDCVTKMGHSYGDSLKVNKNLNGTNFHIDDVCQSFGYPFQVLSLLCGFDELDAGKVMGMSTYGVADKNVPDLFVRGKINPVLVKNAPDFGWDHLAYFKDKNFQKLANLAKVVQDQVKEQAIKFILNAVEKTGAKNVCLSGGYALNCVANYEYLDHLPFGISLYIEPVANDAGISIGAAKYIWHKKTKDTTIRKQNHVYLGGKPNYDLPKDIESQTATAANVAQLLKNGNIVALYQGSAESGPRALGNRSILFDPSVSNGKEIVNTVKGREWFRPFAASVLEHKANEWFHMKSLTSSPFMMYAVQCKEEKKQVVPSVVHVDGTCRIQTVNETQNKNFYDVINEFYKLTSIPLLFNTSFNLAGEPIVDSLEDAINTLKRSKINYLYLPEINLIVKNVNKEDCNGN
jgi:carbamoyltransferase